jgi:glycerol-3-phosphate acyltransferase PlsY
MSFYISRAKKINLKEEGSKNLGASNTLALMGKKAGLAVLVHDVLKSFLVITIIRLCLHVPYNQVGWLLAVGGIFAVVGHIFPFYLKFKGGKGFATYIGVVMGLDWRLFLGIVVLIVVAAFVTDYIVAGTFSTITVAPVYFLFRQEWLVALILLAGSLLILYKHRENIVSIKNGKEMKVRSAFANKYKKSA